MASSTKRSAVRCQPGPGVAEAAMAKCHAEEAAIGNKTADHLEDWQRTALHEAFVHAANRVAVQVRSKGCGLKPGEARDTL